MGVAEVVEEVVVPRAVVSTTTVLGPVVVVLGDIVVGITGVVDDVEMTVEALLMTADETGIRALDVETEASELEDPDTLLLLVNDELIPP